MLLCRLCLAVLLVGLRGVLLRRLERVELYRHRGAALRVVVLAVERARALLGPPEIGRD